MLGTVNFEHDGAEFYRELVMNLLNRHVHTTTCRSEEWWDSRRKNKHSKTNSNKEEEEVLVLERVAIIQVYFQLLSTNLSP